MRLGSKESVTGLTVLLVVLIAIFSWGIFKSDPTEARIDKLLHEPSSGHFGNYGVSATAATQIRLLGTNAIPYLLRELDENCYDSKFDRTIMTLHRSRWVKDNWLPLPHWEFREHIVDAFGNLGPGREAAVPELVKRLTNPKTAELAARALGEIGPRAKDAVPELKRAWQGTNKDIANAAAFALPMITREPLK